MKQSSQVVQTLSCEPGHYPANFSLAKRFRKRSLHWKLLAALVFLLSTTIFTSFAFTPSASAATISPNDIVYGDKWVPISRSYTGTSTGNWTVCVKAQASPLPNMTVCAKTVSFSATVSGNIQVTYNALSAQVGFSVTKTTTTSVSDAVTFPKKVSGRIWWGVVWADYRVGQRECEYIVKTGACVTWLGPIVYATVHKYDYIVYKNTTP